MKKFVKFLLISSLFSLSLWSCVNVHENQVREKRVALVMGTDHYQILKEKYEQGRITSDPTLTKAVKDARDMKDVLKKLGFKVYYKENPTFRHVEVLLKNFTSEIDENTFALVYYSGHGASDYKGLNYLIPSDFGSPESKGFAVDRIAFTMKSKDSSKNVLVLDMCRNNGVMIQGGAKGLGKGDIAIDSEYNPEEYKDDGILISYATGQGNTASEGYEPNSRYTHYLLRHIQDEKLSVSHLFDIVNYEVMKASEKTQNPWKAGSLEGSSLFFAKKPVGSEMGPRP